jgi:outer membrane protein assembly factor BamB
LSHRPAVAGDRLFVGACSGVFYALDKKSGHVLWSYNIKQDGNQSSFHGDILLVDRYVLVGTDRGTDPAGEGHLYAFDKANGKVLWKYLAAPGVSTDLLLDGPDIIAYAANGELISLDLRSGKQIWKRKITEQNSDHYLPPPILHHHVVFAGSVDGNVMAVRAKDGTLLWKQTIEPRAYLEPVAIGNQICVVSTAKYLYRLDSGSGRVLKTMTFESVPSFLPAQARDSILLQFANRTLKRISRKGILWSQSASGELTTHRPLLLDDQVVVADESGRVMALQLADGTIQWSADFGHLKAPITTIGADLNMLYVGTQDGTLYGVDLHQLSRRKK